MAWHAFMVQHVSTCAHGTAHHGDACRALPAADCGGRAATINAASADAEPCCLPHAGSCCPRPSRLSSAAASLYL
eukprot:364367-Chlamydomonas_euryale.AAC.15